MHRSPVLAALVLALVVGCGGGTKAAESAAVPTTNGSSPSAPASTPAALAPPATPATTAAPAAPAPAGDATPAAAASPAKPKPAKISARHVLVQWMGCQQAPASIVRTRNQAHAVAEEVLKRARSGEEFSRLVVEFSDEPNAGARGGSLGRFGHGAMVRQFEEAAFALEPGAISGIVESPFGFHVIQRTE